MLVWRLWVLAMSLQMTYSVLTSGVSQFCEQARNHCLSRVGCQMAFNNFLMGCNDVMEGTTDSCPTNCKHALISLLSTEDNSGIAFVNCNCSQDDFCQNKKRRVEVCAKDVMEFMNRKDEDAVVTCGLARWICEADTSCLAALEYYIRHCAKLVHGEKCTTRCNNSLDILYKQPSSKMLQTCVCDGTEDYDCQLLKDNTEKLCFNRQPNVAYSTVSKTRGVEGSGAEGLHLISGRTVILGRSRARGRVNRTRRFKFAKRRKARRRQRKKLRRARRRRSRARGKQLKARGVGS